MVVDFDHYSKKVEFMRKNFLVVSDSNFFVDALKKYFLPNDFNFAYCITAQDIDLNSMPKFDNKLMAYCNPMRHEHVQSVTKQIIDMHESIDGLIIFLNSEGGEYFSTSPDQWLDYWNYKVLGSIRFINQISKHMKKNKKGKIINILNLEARFPNLINAVGNSADMGLMNLTKAMAAELAPLNINCNSISLGDFEFTKFNNKMNDIPINRQGNSSDLMSLIDYLLTGNSSYIVGENINLDGGFSRIL
jgi:NAD(P)-dependent dehydrogenase (short-subunit alcohol dehydrogenase family)